jgi:hypothetical protein
MSHTALACSMSAIEHPAVYDDVLDLLAESADAQHVLAFRVSDAKQARLDEGLAKNRAGTLTGVESAEVDADEQFEDGMHPYVSTAFPILCPNLLVSFPREALAAWRGACSLS